MSKDIKARAVEVAQQIRKAFKNEEVISFLTEKAKVVEVVPTGIPTLDHALGVGGIPRGRIIEIFGPEGGGKTSTCLSICAQAQKLPGLAAFIDVEHAVDPTWAQKLGVDLDSLLLSQPNSGEEALELVSKLIEAGVDVVVVDSVAAIAPMAELQEDVSAMASGGLGLQARLMSSALRKLASAIGKSRSCVIFTNQVRDRIGLYYGSPENTPGGRALKFYASIRIRVSSKITDSTSKEVTGRTVTFKVVKNKVAPPFKEAEAILNFEHGWDPCEILAEYLIKQELVEIAGSYYKLGDQSFHGRAKLVEALRADPVLFDEARALLASAKPY